MFSSTVGMPPIAYCHFCRRQGWHVICAIKSNRTLGEKKLSQWPHALRHQRYQRVQLSAASPTTPDLSGPDPARKLTKLSFEVCVLISQRHHRDKHPKYFLCTDLTLSAQQILPIYQKRWPIEVDNFYVKQHLGLADFRVQSYEATEKWFAVVFVALAFLQWRLNHAPLRSACVLSQMWCVNIAMSMHAPCWRRPARRRRDWLIMCQFCNAFCLTQRKEAKTPESSYRFALS